MNVIDTALNRVPSWTGVLLHVRDPHHHDYGKYFVVTDSWYQDQANWGIWWDSTKPIDPVDIPAGSKVYEYWGKWDLSLSWGNVFTSPGLWLLTFIIAFMTLATLGQGGTPVIMLGIGVPILALRIVRKREPVLGAKIGYTALATFAVMDHEKAKAEERAQRLGWNSVSEMTMKGGQGMQKADYMARYNQDRTTPMQSAMPTKEQVEAALNTLGLYYGGPR